MGWDGMGWGIIDNVRPEHLVVCDYVEGAADRPQPTCNANTNTKPETRNQKPETRNRKPETRCRLVSGFHELDHTGTHVGGSNEQAQGLMTVACG